MESLADAAEAGAALWASDEGFDAADGDILEERQRAAGGDKASEDVEDLFDVVDGEIVERQAGDDQIVAAVGREIFQTLVKDLSAGSGDAEVGLGFKAGLQVADEIWVEFDERELVCGGEFLDELRGDGAGAGADFEDLALALVD